MKKNSVNEIRDNSKQDSTRTFSEGIDRDSHAYKDKFESSTQ